MIVSSSLCMDVCNLACAVALVLHMMLGEEGLGVRHHVQLLDNCRRCITSW